MFAHGLFYRLGAQRLRHASEDVPEDEAEKAREQSDYEHLIAEAESRLYFAARGFLKGFGLYAVPMLLLRREAKAAPATLKRASAIGSAVFAVRLLQQLTGSNWLLTGAGAGLAFAVVDPTAVNSLIVSWLTTRALRTQLPDLPYGSTALMCASAGVILSSWIFASRNVDPAYWRFLEKHGGQALADMKRLRSDPAPATGCFVHRGQHCCEYPFTFWPEAFVRAVAVYAPLYFIFFLVSRRSMKAVPKFVGHLCRSSAFLASYCTLAWISTCFFYKWVRPGVSRVPALFHTAAAGLALLIERPERRSELATYCCTYATQTLYLTGLEKQIWEPSHPIGILLVVVSFVMLLQNHESLPFLVSDWLLALNRPPRVTHKKDPEQQ